MSKKVLITGGAGFIGSHLADDLLKEGYEVRALDCLSPQVHGEKRDRPNYLHKDVELIIGDIRDKEIVSLALQDVSIVFHLASMVGVGQSMYEIRKYTDVNNLGTAILMECLIDSSVEKLITASSMSIYGEGAYQDGFGTIHHNSKRYVSDLKNKKWELYNDGQELQPVPTSENKVPALSSVYALSKYDQERLSLITGEAYNIPTTALRFFNVYGTRQALSNPYTGVLAIFASRFINNKPPVIFEDGNQQRDFIHVSDVARACVLAMESEKANGEVFNIGSGKQYKISFVAQKLAHVMGKEIKPEISGEYRVGDIRHCFGDISKARKLLSFEPQKNFDDGLLELSQWLEHQIANDSIEKANQELSKRGLTI
ncbi:dehydratase [Salegentibacter salinarum]|uniref:Dehydratase n=1 Tax=Salegentibacter salinarum TaxID=447422 RepID=A0A2N0TNB8_9FLAO|nr:NAD-dependent epimerase/dehydratase family protein [Salegentibacter salinarum]PKD16216.1 dehydratase [Salegentibacter salinarum]SKB67817.1 dTDP-L-rhamnose 4-epimerase [Salegentibacter salinarum]